MSAPKVPAVPVPRQLTLLCDCFSPAGLPPFSRSGRASLAIRTSSPLSFLIDPFPESGPTLPSTRSSCTGVTRAWSFTGSSISRRSQSWGSVMQAKFSKHGSSAAAAQSVPVRGSFRPTTSVCPTLKNCCDHESGDHSALALFRGVKRGIPAPYMLSDPRAKDWGADPSLIPETTGTFTRDLDEGVYLVWSSALPVSSAYSRHTRWCSCALRTTRPYPDQITRNDVDIRLGIRLWEQANRRWRGLLRP